MELLFEKKKNEEEEKLKYNENKINLFRKKRVRNKPIFKKIYDNFFQ
jgi:hypothetical protein